AFAHDSDGLVCRRSAFDHSPAKARDAALGARRAADAEQEHLARSAAAAAQSKLGRGSWFRFLRRVATASASKRSNSGRLGVVTRRSNLGEEYISARVRGRLYRPRISLRVTAPGFARRCNSKKSKYPKKIFIWW